MKIYLMRHGHAIHARDGSNYLSEKGISETKKMAKWFKEKAFKVDLIYHSPIERAIETTNIMLEEIGPIEKIEFEKMKPLDPPGELFNKISMEKTSILLIGHGPHLEKLCTFFVNGEDSGDTVLLANSHIVCLSSIGTFRINWSLYPELLI